MKIGNKKRGESSSYLYLPVHWFIPFFFGPFCHGRIIFYILYFQDGRLLVNDQLLVVNGESLKDLSNSESMEVLRKAMQKEGDIPGHIHLVIARRIGAPSPSPYQESSMDFSFHNQSKSSDLSESNDSREVC